MSVILRSLLYTKYSFYAPKSGGTFDTFSGNTFSIYIHGFEIICQLYGNPLHPPIFFFAGRISSFVVEQFDEIEI